MGRNAQYGEGVGLGVGDARLLRSSRTQVFGEADELDIFFSPRPSVSSRLLVFARGIFLLLMSD